MSPAGQLHIIDLMRTYTTGHTPRDRSCTLRSSQNGSPPTTRTYYFPLDRENIECEMDSVCGEEITIQFIWNDELVLLIEPLANYLQACSLVNSQIKFKFNAATTKGTFSFASPFETCQTFLDTLSSSLHCTSIGYGLRSSTKKAPTLNSPTMVTGVECYAVLNSQVRVNPGFPFMLVMPFLDSIPLSKEEASKMNLTKVATSDRWLQYGITIMAEDEWNTSNGIPQSCQYEFKYKIHTHYNEVQNIMLVFLVHSNKTLSHGSVKQLPSGAEQVAMFAFKRAMDQLSSQNEYLRLVSEDTKEAKSSRKEVAVIRTVDSIVSILDRSSNPFLREFCISQLGVGSLSEVQGRLKRLLLNPQQKQTALTTSTISAAEEDSDSLCGASTKAVACVQMCSCVWFFVFVSVLSSCPNVKQLTQHPTR